MPNILTRRALFLFPIFVSPFLNTLFFKVGWGEFFAILLWPIVILLLSLAFFPLLDFFLSTLPKKPIDAGIGISKCFSLLVLFFLVWNISQLGFSLYTLLGIFLTAIFTFLLIVNKQGLKVIRNKILEGSYFLIHESLFFGLYFTFLVFLSWHPDIYWTEKPMDFSILNYLGRLDGVRVEDPWAAGSLMHYYYFGYYIFAGLGKISWLSNDVLYLVSMATIPALLGNTLFSFFLWVTKSKKISFLGSLFFLFSSNIASVINWFGNQKLEYSHYWKSTRVFRDSLFTEYPFWSFIHADLHPHVMSYPFLVTFLFLLIPFLQKQELSWKNNKYFFVLVGFCWGALLAINSWDYLFYGAFFGLTLLLANNKRNLILDSLLKGAGIAIISLALYFPFFLLLRTGKQSSFSFLEAFNDINHIFAHQGFWWILLFILWGGLSYYFSLRKKQTEVIFISSVFLISGVILQFFIERFILNDRINTLFKFSIGIWVLNGIAGLLLLRYLKVFKKVGGWGRVINLSVWFILICSVFGSSLNLLTLKKHSWWPEKTLGLNGSKFLKIKDPEAYEIIHWINRSIEGTPRLLESYGDSFGSNTAIISSHTGLPSYLGWRGHVELRGLSKKTIQARTREIDIVYGGKSAKSSYQLMKRMGIQLLYVGKEERRRYTKDKLIKFGISPHYFRPIKKSGESILYQLL